MGAYTKDDEAETAQQTYRRMLRDGMAPALRQMGFKGSGAHYRFPDETYEAGLIVRKWSYSTKEVAYFDVGWFVRHPPTMDAYNSAPRDARSDGKPTAGYYGESLEDLVWRRDNLFEEFRQSGYTVNRPGWWEMPTGTRISPWFGWWSLPAGGPIEPLAQTVIKAIRELGLPAIQREIERPLDPRWAIQTSD